MPQSDNAPPVFRRTYRLLMASLLVGVVGAGAALAFEFLVELSQGLLLSGIGGYTPPEVGTLEPEVTVPSGLSRLWLPVVTTLGGLLSGLLVYRFAPEAEGHGTDAAISAYHEHGGSVRPRIPLIKAISSALTIGSGGVAGKEGPTAQIAVGLGGIFTRWLRLRGGERRSVLLAAMAAGLAAMFRAPLGMAIFTVEVLYAGMVFESEALIYTVIAAVTSYAVFGFFSGWESIFVIPGGLSFHEPAALAGFALLGVLAGLIGAVLPTLLYRTQALFRRMPGPPHLRPAVGGLLVGLMAIAAPEILGTGYGWVELAMAEKLGLTTILLVLVLKGPAMALTIGSGGSGGVFAPTVTLGATLGAAVGILLQGLLPGVETPVAAYVVVGMAAIFAGAARTPISTLIMVAEMTGGYGLIVLAFLVQSGLTHNRLFPTLYRSQVETREDSPLHRGVFVRRAIEMVERGHIDSSEIRLPRLVNLLRYGEPIPVAEGEELLMALEVEPGSRLDGTTVMDSLGRIEGATAVAVLREEEMLVPRGPTTFAAGDRVLIVATTAAVKSAREMANVARGQNNR